jgi:hypothetical protein
VPVTLGSPAIKTLYATDCGTVSRHVRGLGLNERVAEGLEDLCVGFHRNVIARLSAPPLSLANGVVLRSTSAPGENRVAQSLETFLGGLI